MPALLTRTSIGPTSASIPANGVGNLGRLGHVEHRCRGLGAFAAQCVDRRVDGTFRSAVDDDAAPGAGEAAREREADAGRRAGHQHDGAGEAEQTIDEAVHGTLLVHYPDVIDNIAVVKREFSPAPPAPP